ncbi:MAG: GntR family transcriptional regulator [Firmicutes bacterium]|nr:GntR family transcriptional regulator [Bacillota bacterium]
MWLRVDPRRSKPLYQQIVDAVKEAVAKKVLEEGERLPSVRELAASMTLNPNTVAKAYQELERAGVIEVIRGRGTFVAALGAKKDHARRLAAMQELIKQVWIEAQHLQMSHDDLLSFVQHTIAEWDREKGRDGK